MQMQAKGLDNDFLSAFQDDKNGKICRDHFIQARGTTARGECNSS
jgi:hypothetical protein